MNILFDYHINFLSDSDNNCKLPFSVFGMSQQGLSHQSYSIGNQDAGCIFIGRNLIIGAVADGCTSGQNLNGMSSNQVGAHIVSYLAVRAARKLILKRQLELENMLHPFQQTLLADLRKTLNALNPWKFEREGIVKNFLAATLIAFVILPDNYIVFSCGDGDAYINSEKKELTAAGGKYFSNNLLDLRYDSASGYSINPDNQIHSIGQGKTANLDNLLIATDGFIDSDVGEDKSFQDFFFTRENLPLKTGFVDRKIEFRTNVLENVTESKNGRLWPLDDATFISIKRSNHQNS